ncbi:MAG: single-stranded DNA-binding protein [Planctomycetia bacterium]|mgnify:FL=1|jgi:single-strand DNA-binding protein|nr:single-stranded DNA-binding protein [Planctomycetota bacterium]NCF55471.1 single-stranded DNA-binding protein [Planctomycetia bacterium]NCG57193.1 single-stranded DNA-binding protein [Pseudomonadota bacterium]MDC0347648.1 single-stranded DNA-binding protein [Planctomycetota bacterium]MDG2084362.1 single-stranded DNA-binding protein [Planctomycetota bacterium]
MEFNKVFIVGNLTRDPELRMIPSGTAVCNLGIASNRKYKRDGASEFQEETTFVDVTVWGRQAEISNQYLSKGSGVLIEGRLKTDQWQDKETGKNRSKLTVVADRVNFMPRGGQASGGAGNSREGSQSFGNESPPAAGGSSFPQGETYNDEVPF